jgi:hypothetical protein
MLLLVAATFASVSAHAHGISESSRETMSEGGLASFVWLGAEHMVTGYDHLLFLFGVIFFLTGFRDIVRFITAFTLGHCITLLGATLLGISANAYLIDAVIALSVIYKGFENLDGFNRYVGVRAPNLLLMVFGFGLIHGFGLSTRLQELSLGSEGLVAKILAFNVGVELGQIAALSVMLGVFALWRSAPSFERAGRAANVALVAAGALLFVFQMVSFLSDGHAHDAHTHGGHAHAEEIQAHGEQEQAHEDHTHVKKAQADDEHPHDEKGHTPKEHGHTHP